MLYTNLVTPSALSPLWATIARELAQDILTPPEILENHGFTGIDDPRWIRIATNPEFTRLMQEARTEWHSADSTPKRIRAKAQAIIETYLPSLYSTLTDGSASGTVKSDTLKAVMRLGGLDTPAAPAGGKGEGSGFSLTINIGEKRVSVTTSTPIIDGFAETHTGPTQIVSYNESGE